LNTKRIDIIIKKRAYTDDQGIIVNRKYDAQQAHRKVIVVDVRLLKKFVEIFQKEMEIKK
jgi:hypothetical protein